MKLLTRSVIFAGAALFFPAAHAQIDATCVWETAWLYPIRGLCSDPSGDIYAIVPQELIILYYRRTGSGFEPRKTLSAPGLSSTYGSAVTIEPHPPGSSIRKLYYIHQKDMIRVLDHDVEAGTATLSTTINRNLDAIIGDLDAFTGFSEALTHLRFDPTGEWLYITQEGYKRQGYPNSRVSRIIVLRKVNEVWTDTGIRIMPETGSSATFGLDPRQNQGPSIGTAVDANGNIWVSGFMDPLWWDGSYSGQANHTFQYGAYARPIRFYQRAIADDGRVSFVPTGVIPMDNKIAEIEIRGDGVLFAAESLNATLEPGLGLSHRIYAFRGLNRMGFIDTGTGDNPLEDLRCLSIAPGDSHLSVSGFRSSNNRQYIQHLDVGTIPGVPSCLVRGRVTDADTGAALAGVTVRLFDQSAVTDANGHYEATVPDSGAASVHNPGAPLPPDPYYIVHAEAEGYRTTVVEPVRVRSETVLDITMHAVSSGVSISFGVPDVERGLRIVYHAYGDTGAPPDHLPATVGRQIPSGVTMPVAVTGNKRSEDKLYLDVDDAFQNGVKTPALLIASWYGHNTSPSDPWRLIYDSNVGKTSGNVSFPGPGSPRAGATAFYLPNAWFGNRQDSGSDLHFLNPNGASLTLFDVAITHQMQSFRPGVVPAGWSQGVNLAPRFVDTAPTVFNGIAYVGVRSPTRLYAIDLATRAPLVGFGTNGYIGASDLIVGRPTLYLDGDGDPHVVYATANGAVHSVDGRTGASDWPSLPGTGAPCFPFGETPATITSAPSVYVDTTASPVVPVIWVGVNTADGAWLVRLRGDDPEEDMLTLELTDGSTDISTISCTPAIGAGGTRVMAGYTQGGNGHLLMVSNPEVGQTGGGAPTVYTDITVPGEAINTPATITRNGTTLLLGSANDTTGHVWAANKDNGQPIWSVETGPVEWPMWLDYTPPAETLYVMTRDNRLHALNLSDQGRIREGWPVQPPMGAFGGPVFTIGNNLYAGSTLGLMMLDKKVPDEIAILASMDLGAQTLGTTVPALTVGASVSGQTTQDIIVATGTDGKLYAIQVQP